MLGDFLLYFEVGTLALRVEEMDERADIGNATGAGAFGSCISPALGAVFPGIMKTCSSRPLAGPVVLASLLDILEERASSRRCGWCELPIS